MSLQDQITVDQQSVTDAQTALDAANAKLAADQAALAAVQPHLDLLSKIESELGAVEDDVEDALRAALDDIKARISPLIEQMRQLLL